MKWIYLSVFVVSVVGGVTVFGIGQYFQTQQKFITDGYQHCPYKGAYGYYWAKTCNQ